MAKTDKQQRRRTSGFEAELFRAADKLRGNMEPSDYKHVALGLIFLKHISDSFEAKHTDLLANTRRRGGPGRIRRRECLLGTEGVPLVSSTGQRQAAGDRQANRRSHACHRKGHPSLKGVLPKDYARPALNAVMLGELIDLISGIAMGEGRDKSRDVLGRVYEYFLGQFAGSEGKRGGEFYTPRFRRAHHGRDAGAPQGPGIRPLLRIGGMFVQSEKSSNPMKAAWAISPSMARRAITSPGASPR